MENKFKEYIEILNKLGYEFLGYDSCDYCFRFNKVDKVLQKITKIGVSNIAFTCECFDLNKPFEFESILLFDKELEVFCKLMKYFKDGGSADLSLAKKQKDLDRACKWEMGETYCTYENGILSCGVLEEEEFE